MLLLVQDKERLRKMQIESLPCLSTLVDTDIIHMIKWTKPSSLHRLHTASDQKLNRWKIVHTLFSIMLYSTLQHSSSLNLAALSNACNTIFIKF